MGKKITISVVIPTYNREKNILESVKSVLSQTLLPDEIIIVDDGSSDQTVEVLEQAQEPLVKIYRNTTNHGAQHARNIGIKLATSHWIAFLDSDDFWVPNKLELQVKELAKRNYDDKIVLYSDVWLKKHQDENLIWQPWPVYNQENPLETILSTGGACFQSMLVSKEALNAIGYLDESVPAYQEWDTTIRLASVCRFTHIAEPLFIWNRHRGETISGNHLRSLKGYDYVVEKHKKIIWETGGYSLWRQHVLYRLRRRLELNIREEFCELLGELDPAKENKQIIRAFHLFVRCKAPDRFILWFLRIFLSPHSPKCIVKRIYQKILGGFRWKMK